jgi:hypothetical protein
MATESPATPINNEQKCSHDHQIVAVAQEHQKDQIAMLLSIKKM